MTQRNHPEALTGFLHEPIHHRRCQRPGFTTWPMHAAAFQAGACMRYFLRINEDK